MSLNDFWRVIYFHRKHMGARQQSALNKNLYIIPLYMYMYMYIVYTCTIIHTHVLNKSINLLPEYTQQLSNTITMYFHLYKESTCTCTVGGGTIDRLHCITRPPLYKDHRSIGDHYRHCIIIVMSVDC